MAFAKRVPARRTQRPRPNLIEESR